MVITDSRQLELNMLFEIKRIIEQVCKVKNFKYLVENPDDESEINTATLKAKKLPCVVLEIDEFSSQPIEMGGGIQESANFFIDVMCEARVDSRDIGELLVKNLEGYHKMYDFSTLDSMPNPNSESYDESKMPTAELNEWFIDVGAMSRILFRVNPSGQKQEASFVKRWQMSINGEVTFLRNF